VLRARRILILGGGAVGVELAAEIVDYFPTKQVTLLDAQSSLVPNFPRAVADYAHQWLLERGVDLILGEKLQSWNDTSCALQDGTVLQADIVYVCFGNRPNSQLISTSRTTAALSTGTSEKFMLNGRRNVMVDSTLRVQGGPIQDGSIFACGDVASPPSNDEKQALQAEIQGKAAARNIILAAMPSSSQNKYRYPEDIAGSGQMPLVFVLTLGRSDGVLGFNKLCLPGPLAAVFKFILEYTKVLHMLGKPLEKLIWKISDAVVLFLSHTLIKPPSHMVRA
jgi:NADH dehydrogenase FAD-containing subunit